MIDERSLIHKKYAKQVVNIGEILRSTKPITANVKNKETLFVGLVKDGSRNNYYTKYEKFLIENNIKYDYYDPDSSSFIEEAKRFNLIIWRIPDSLPDVSFCKNKIYFIEKELKIMVYPSYKDVWCYEDKSLEYFLFKNNCFNIIPTFYTNKYSEAQNYIENAKYPIVSKELTSCSSLGVRLLKNKKTAARFIKKVFGEGNKSSFPWVKQKNYVLFQQFIPNGNADIRVVCIGGMYFAGYYRFAKKKDFRASGSGLVEKKEIPEILLHQTKEIYEKLGLNHMFAVDFLETTDNQHFIIESSQFIGIETPQQTKKNGVSGIYSYDKVTNSFVFIEGDYWLQELDLKLLFEEGV